MYGARLPRQVDLAGAHDDRKAAKPFSRARSFVARPSVRRCLERALAGVQCMRRRLRGSGPYGG
jgi:hypothetical protein